MAFGFATLIGLSLLTTGAWRNQTNDYWYLGYNLFLGFIPLVLALWLRRLLRTHSWWHWASLVVTAVWLFFLPNSFYIVTDFIHLPETQRVDIVQDSVMIMQFSVLGLFFGYMSLFIVQRELRKRISQHATILIALLTLFISSFAIYIGRELRWNSWDIFLNPLNLGTDILLHFIYPLAYPNMISITLSFFFMLASFYAIIYLLLPLLRQARH